MDTKAIAKCEIRLAAAAKAVGDLREWTTFQDFDVAWFSFLSSWKAVYTALEQGVKGHQRSTQWFGLRNKARRADELLQYLYQARNDDTHGLEEQSRKTPAASGIGRPIDPSRPVAIKNMIVTIGNGVTHVRADRADNLDLAPFHIPAQAALLPVRDRDKANGRVYQPPTMHLGQPLADTSPLAVAELGLAYVRDMVEDAKSLV